MAWFDYCDGVGRPTMTAVGLSLPVLGASTLEVVPSNVNLDDGGFEDMLPEEDIDMTASFLDGIASVKNEIGLHPHNQMAHWVTPSGIS